MSATKNYRILIVDDEPEFHQEIRYAFRRNFAFEGAIGIQQLEKKLKEYNNFDLVLLDLVLDNTEKKIGLELLPYLREKLPNVPIIIVTKDEKTDTIVEAMKVGADDFLPKRDFKLEIWKEKFTKLIEISKQNKNLKQELKQAKAKLEYVNPKESPLIGSSPQIEHIRKTIKILADEPDLTVLITGETGVGKGVAARFLHFNSQTRSQDPFEEIHISNIPKSLMESTLFGARKGTFTGADKDIKGRLHMADKGIVFLDEIGDLDLENQRKLLQFLQTKTIRPIGSHQDIQLDILIVAATNKNLREEIAKGNFREDLYQRLKVYPIEIPPLRERREDIVDLLVHFMKLDSADHLDLELAPDTKQILLEEYSWIGNVRELENTVRNMKLKQKVHGTSRITMECLPDEITNPQIQVSGLVTLQSQTQPKELKVAKNNGKPAGLNFKQENDWNTLAAIEKALIEKNGVKKDVASMLKMGSDDHLRYKIKKLYMKHHPWFEHFPKIQEKYQRILKKINIDKT